MQNKIVYILAQALRRAGYDFHEAEDSRVMAMRNEIRRLGGIQFEIEVAADGSWAAESTNIDGIISGGSNVQNIRDTLKDATFTYFKIPAHLCNDALIRSVDEPLKIEQRVYA